MPQLQLSSLLSLHTILLSSILATTFPLLLTIDNVESELFSQSQPKHWLFLKNFIFLKIQSKNATINAKIPSAIATITSIVLLNIADIIKNIEKKAKPIKIGQLIILSKIIANIIVAKTIEKKTSKFIIISPPIYLIYFMNLIVFLLLIYNF